jgi:hypothetical protein
MKATDSAPARSPTPSPAVTRLLGISENIGCRGLLIHAGSEEARDFYRRLIPELTSSPTDGLHLVLLMKNARRTLLGARELTPDR